MNKVNGEARAQPKNSTFVDSIKPLHTSLYVLGMSWPSSLQGHSPCFTGTVKLWCAITGVVMSAHIGTYVAYTADSAEYDHPRQWTMNVIMLCWYIIGVTQCVNCLWQAASGHLQECLEKITAYDARYPLPEKVQARCVRFVRIVVAVMWAVSILNGATLLINSLGAFQTTKLLYRGLYYPFNDPRYSFFYTPAYLLMSGWTCVIAAASLTYTYVLCVRFDQFNDQVLSAMDGGVLPECIGTLRVRFNQVAACVGVFDKPLGITLGFSCTVGVPAVCLIAYTIITLLKYEDRTEECVALTLWFVTNIASVMMLLTPAARLHRHAHNAKSILYVTPAAEEGQWSLGRKSDMDLLLHQLSDGGIGISYFGWFVITTDTVIAAVTAYITYLALVMQVA